LSSALARAEFLLLLPALDVVSGHTNHERRVFCTTTKNRLSHEQYNRMLTDEPTASRRWLTNVHDSTQCGHNRMMSM
jgi:hypothetical protein